MKRQKQIILNGVRHSMMVIIMLAALVSVGCRREEDEASASHEDTTYTVAVIYPLEGHGEKHVKAVAEWALQNFERAQRSINRRVKIKLEWYDEDKEDLYSLGNTLRLRPDIRTVVGPLSSENADVVAGRLKLNKKTLILPCATSAELVRSYAGEGFMWSLTESDITQCEVLLTRARNTGMESVALLACDNSYGQTFIDWFAFQATELGLEVEGVYTYHDDNDRRQAIDAAYESSAEMLICVPRGCEDARAVIAKKYNEFYEGPEFMFSDAAYTPELLEEFYDEESGDYVSTDYIEGVTPSSDPTSGFDVAYKVHFGTLPQGNESQLYDAVMLAALASVAYDCGMGKTMNDAISAVVATADKEGNASQPMMQTWTDDGMELVVRAMREGKQMYDINGATGPLDFDKELNTTVVHSVYAHWINYHGAFLTLNHLSSNGSARVEATLASWNWKPSVIEDVVGTSNAVVYPELKGNWALLVAGSESWKNYRHQADVLNMYQILKYMGYDDDHIVLIMKDDIANNAENPNKGQVLRYDGINLYVDVNIDYNLDDISADDIEKILLGQRSERLPKVIEATANDNVLVFWSGHGVQGSLLLGERGSENGLTDERMVHLMESLKDHRHHRKMLWLIEACYSASVALATEYVETPGVMMITAANVFETSKADVKIDGIYRTNRFTEMLTSSIANDPNISFRNLYYYLSRETLGSHVMVLGSQYFDNLFSSTLSEFIIPVKKTKN